MMPKGVEHRNPDAGALQGQPVRVPMMPKGVEHQVNHHRVGKLGREGSNDAERR